MRLVTSNNNTGTPASDPSIYLGHLAELLKDEWLFIRPEERIHFQMGGAADFKELLAHFVKRHSVERLEKCLGFHERSDTGWLKEAIEQFVGSNPCIRELYAKSEAHAVRLNVAINGIAEQHALIFRIKVFSLCFDEDFERALFCCVMVILESEFSNRDEQLFLDLFYGALTHDIGFLETVSVKPYSARRASANNQMNQTHVEASARFLSNLNFFSPAMLSGVMEHHERMDGTGFPRGLMGVRLKECGQHIHLYDAIFTLFHYRFRPYGKLLGDLVPVIEINSITHFGQVAQGVIHLLSDAARSPSNVDSQKAFDRIKNNTVELDRYVQSCLGVIKTFTDTVGFRHEDKSLLVLQNGFFHIALAQYKSQNYHAFPSGVSIESAEYGAPENNVYLEDSFLMLKEIAFHIDEFHHKLTQFSYACKQNGVLEHALDTLNKLDDLVGGIKKIE